MTKFVLGNRRQHWPKRVVYVAVALVVLLLAAVLVEYRVYDQNLRPLDHDTTTYNIVIPSGSTPKDIALKLKGANLIRSDWALEWYVRSHELGSKLQAGTYAFKSSQSIPEMVNMMAEGKIVKNLIILLPGQRLDQLRDTFVNAKFSPEAVDAALDAGQYKDVPALADKPSGASLEGFLYPDTFQKDSTTDPKLIVQQSLAEMDQHLTPELRAAYASKGLTVYQAVTLASIIEQEVSNPNDRPIVAQVFLKRLQTDMPLGSDVTVFYSQRVHNPAYDTTANKGLPPGPISNVTDSALRAVAYPANTDWLYFVSGDDGVTHFSKTLAEHQALTKQYCHKLCSSAN